MTSPRSGASGIVRRAQFPEPTPTPCRIHISGIPLILPCAIPDNGQVADPDLRHHDRVEHRTPDELNGDQAHLATLMQAIIDIHPMRNAHPDWAYRCVEQLVLHRGHWYTPAPLPTQRDRGDERHCFTNATRHSRVYHQTYVEGYALGPHGLVYEHAWCARPDGTLEDPTWPDGAGLAYIGIPFIPGYIARFEQRRDTTARLLFDAHLDGWELLRSGLPATMGSTPVQQ
jgi:hypothetical protein